MEHDHANTNRKVVAQPVSAQKRFFPGPRGKFQSNNSFRNQSYRRSTFVRQQKNDSFGKNPNNRSSWFRRGPGLLKAQRKLTISFQLTKQNKATGQSCSRTNQTFLFKLGNDHNRSLDPRNCEGIQNPLCLSAQTMEKETHKSKVESRHQFYKRSHFSASTKRSN